MKSATDTALDAVENEIESLRRDVNMVTAGGIERHSRLQRLYLRRDELQKRQFKALQRKVKRMPK